MQECKKHKNDTDNRGEGVWRLLANVLKKSHFFRDLSSRIDWLHWTSFIAGQDARVSRSYQTKAQDRDKDKDKD